MTYLTLDGEIQRINVKGIYPLARKNDAMTYLAIPKCYHRKTKLQQPP